MSVGRYAFGREVQVQRTGVQEFRSSGVQEWWSGLLVNTAAVWGIYLSLGIKVHHYPK
jgi:hypothetical protein